MKPFWAGFESFLHCELLLPFSFYVCKLKNWMEITGNEFYVLCSSQRSHLFLFNYVRNEWSNANKIKTDLRKKSYIVCQKTVYRTPQNIEILRERVDSTPSYAGMVILKRFFLLENTNAIRIMKINHIGFKRASDVKLKKWNHSFKNFFTPLHGFVVLVLFSVERWNWSFWKL